MNVLRSDGCAVVGVAASALASVWAYEDGVIAEAAVDASTEQAIRDVYQASIA